MNQIYTTDKEQLRATVIAQLHALAENGRAPSREKWDAQRQPGVPCYNYARKLYGNFSQLAISAGLTPSTSGRPATDPRAGSFAEEIDRHVAQGAELDDWNARYHAALHVLPTPTRSEVVFGRTIAGQPCVIERIYWMVR